MFAAVAIVVAGALVHATAGRLVACPWLMPDVLLACLAGVIMRRPEQAWGAIAAAAAMALIVAGTHPRAVSLAYAAAGLSVLWLTITWDMTDVVVRLTVVAVLEAVLALGWLMGGGHLTLELLGLAVGRVLLTGACFPLLLGAIGRLLPTSS